MFNPRCISNRIRKITFIASLTLIGFLFFFFLAVGAPSTNVEGHDLDSPFLLTVNGDTVSIALIA